MAGTKVGAIKARNSIIERYGSNYYAEIGRKGGKNGSVNCGFASNPELAKQAGRIGGKISSRKGIKNGEGKKWINN